MKKTKEVYLAGGCFWGLEKYMSGINGVLSTEVGYANGKTESPSYEEVCSGGSGHAETVRVAYDPDSMGLPLLLYFYYQAIDPTSKNRQGNDVGPQYRTGIYYMDEAELPVIRHSIDLLQRRCALPVAVEVQPLSCFYPAEAYHQNYLGKTPFGYCHIDIGRMEWAYQASRDAEKLSEIRDTALAVDLSDLQYEVARQGHTEPPFRNEYWNQDSEGIYVDIVTGEPLFLSSDKFDAGCGWPSFTRPIDGEALKNCVDRSFGMERVEVRSRGGDTHLGHVFDDGPADRGGLRYCINSAALRFVPKADMEKEGYGSFLDYFD